MSVFGGVRGLLVDFQRPMTVSELLLRLDGVVSRGAVYREIKDGLRRGLFVDMVLDLRPLYQRRLRLVALSRDDESVGGVVRIVLKD